LMESSLRRSLLQLRGDALVCTLPTIALLLCIAGRPAHMADKTPPRSLPHPRRDAQMISNFLS
jgi:hypothetical protein